MTFEQSRAYSTTDLDAAEAELMQAEAALRQTESGALDFDEKKAAEARTFWEQKMSKYHEISDALGAEYTEQ